MEINEAAVQQVVEGMKSYRPDLTEDNIRKIIQDCAKHGAQYSPPSETDQDVWWAYLDAAGLK